MGSNLGAREDHLKQAREEMSLFLTELKYSSVYQTEPVGFSEQPWFLNQVCVGKTDLYPFELLLRMKEIEKKLGRVPGPRFGPRQIDLDLIFYDHWALFSEVLTIPHPRYKERSFVLRPLMEILPEWRDPLTGVSPKEYWEKGKDGFTVCEKARSMVTLNSRK